MKSLRIFPLLLLLTMVGSVVLGQSDQELDQWNQRRLQIQERQMYVLGGWAGATLAFSGIQ